MKRSRVGTAIGDRDPDQQVLFRGFGVFGLDIEIAVLVENAGVDQFVLKIRSASAGD